MNVLTNHAADMIAVTHAVTEILQRFNGHFPGEPGLAGVY